jgi:hypothetical protein
VVDRSGSGLRGVTVRPDLTASPPSQAASAGRPDRRHPPHRCPGGRRRGLDLTRSDGQVGSDGVISRADPWLCRPGYLDLIDEAGAGDPEGQGRLTDSERDTYRIDFDAAARTIAGEQDVHFGQTHVGSPRGDARSHPRVARVGDTRSSVMIEKMLGQSLDSLSAQLHTPRTALLQMQQPDNDAGCAAGALATLPTEMTEVKSDQRRRVETASPRKLPGLVGGVVRRRLAADALETLSR